MMKKLQFLSLCLCVLAGPALGQLTVTNMATSPPSTATTIGACHTVDLATVQVGTGSCLRSGAAPSNQCFLPTGVALDPTTAGGCPLLGATGAPTNAGFTIEFWFMPSASGLFAYTFGDASWVGAAGAFRCFMNGAAGVGNFLLRGPLTQLATAGAPLTTAVPGTWIHFAVVVNGSANTITWYVNGALNSTGPANIAGSGTNFTCMGYNGSSAVGADGNYDDYRVYNWARDGADITADYNDGLNGIGVFGQAPLGPSTCFNLPDEAYYEIDVSQNAHNATIARGTEPGYAYTRLFTDGDALNWGVSSPAPGPFPGSALINVFFGAGASPRVEGYNDPTAVPGGPYVTILGTTSYGGLQLGHCLSTPVSGASLLFMWPDSIGLGALGLAPCGGSAIPSTYVYGAGLTPTNPLFVVPTGLFNTGDRIDLQWLAPDSTFFQAGGLATSNRTVYEYVAATPGEHAHVEARGLSPMQVATFFEIHNTGNIPIQQICIDLSATGILWSPTAAMNSGGTLTTMDTFRRDTHLICDLDTTLGPTLNGLHVNTLVPPATGANLCFDFLSVTGPGGGFEGPTDHFIFDCQLAPTTGSGATLAGAAVTITYFTGVVQTGTMIADPADPNAAVLDT
ncbi:MAG: LamG domain-containing protein [Planctomycetes bacterium]|nr:LamG domain-containing protein [Planctomycetota bacterium]